MAPPVELSPARSNENLALPEMEKRTFLNLTLSLAEVTLYWYRPSTLTVVTCKVKQKADGIMSIDPKCIELTADVFGIFFLQILWCSAVDATRSMKRDVTKATVGGVPPFSLLCLSHSHE